MALIERIALNEPHFIADRSVHAASETEVHSDVERVPELPGLRIQSRPTTASLSDYALYDLKTLLRDEVRKSLSDGVGG